MDQTGRCGPHAGAIGSAGEAPSGCVSAGRAAGLGRASAGAADPIGASRSRRGPGPRSACWGASTSPPSRPSPHRLTGGWSGCSRPFRTAWIQGPTGGAHPGHRRRQRVLRHLPRALASKGHLYFAEEASDVQERRQALNCALKSTMGGCLDAPKAKALARRPTRRLARASLDRPVRRRHCRVARLRTQPARLARGARHGRARGGERPAPLRACLGPEAVGGRGGAPHSGSRSPSHHGRGGRGAARRRRTEGGPAAPGRGRFRLGARGFTPPIPTSP